MKRFIAIITFFCVAACHAQPLTPLEKSKSDNTMLWQVSGNGLEKPSYLFGTVHLLCPDDIHFSDQLKTAMQRSDTVYMELKMDDPSTMLGGMMYMTMKDGKTLRDFYSESEYDKLNNFFKDSLKMPLAMFQKMKPYFLVSMFYPRLMDCKTPSGVDMELVKLSKQYAREIKGLETIKFQASVFDSIPYEFQAKELLKSLDSIEMMKMEFHTLIRLYKEQKLDSVAKLTSESEFSEDKYGNILLSNRNKNWVDQLDTIMKNTSVFVAVGAGHLPGREGLIELLQQRGYQVEPLRN